MSELPVEATSAPQVPLTSPLPGRYPTEPRTLTEFREHPADEKSFLKLRRSFREAKDWRALAVTLNLHAAELAGLGATAKRAADLYLQSSDLWADRIGDRNAAAHALERAVVLQPDNTKALEKLRALYKELSQPKKLVQLLKWQLKQPAPGTDIAAHHVELGTLLENEFLALGEAAGHYEAALQLQPDQTGSAERLVALYQQAGAWTRVGTTLSTYLSRLDPTEDRTKIAEVHRQLAAIESAHHDDVATAARHLQAALKAVHDDIDALEAFGELYLSSSEREDEGVSKAAEIFFKAAELSRRRGDPQRAIKLLRRTLKLAPAHQQSSAALEGTLIDAEDWLALDDLYREWLVQFSGPDAAGLMMRRANLLDTRLHRREEARQLYEEASRYQKPDDESWRHLEQIYDESGDYHALAALLDAQAERMPDEVSTDTLLRAAAVYREELGLEEKAAVYYYKVLEREPFNALAFEGYKEHWRRKHNWGHLRDLILYQIEQAATQPEEQAPIGEAAFAEEFVELAEICERRLGDIDGAFDAWGRLAAAYPDDPRPAKHIARIEKRARMWDNMVRVQEAELDRTTDPAKRLDILKRLTQVYRDRQVNPSRAIELYNEILQLSPHDIQATRALTTLYDRAGDYPQVVAMLREQFDRSRSNTERVAVLRRMAELWHNELDEPSEAIWACEQILERTPNDREALYRLQQILEEQGSFEQLLDVLGRELNQTKSNETRVKVLRRMTRVAEHDLGDIERAAELWSEIAALRPGNVEVIDRLLNVYAAAGRYEDLGNEIGKAAAARDTPVVRQVDYYLRLGQLAQDHLEDPGLARTSFERVLRNRADHRGALEALVQIYRREDEWRPLVSVLGRLQGLADSARDAFKIAAERSELLGGPLSDPEGAAALLAGLEMTPGVTPPLFGETLLELYQAAQLHRETVRQAELVLLSEGDPTKRRALYELVTKTWRDLLEDPPAALAAFSRLVAERPDDLEVLWAMADLQIEVGEHEAAVATLGHRLALAPDVPTKTQSLEQMAAVAQEHLGDGPRAIEFLRQALAVDHFNEEIIDKLADVARECGGWAQLLTVMQERFGYLVSAANFAGALAVCLDAAEIAETKYEKPARAFEWCRQGYFVALEHNLDGSGVLANLERIATEHGLHRELLAVIEREIAHQQQRGADQTGTYDPVQRYVYATEIAEDRLEDGPLAVRLLQQAYQLRPDDESLGNRLEHAARRYGLWPAVIELYRSRLVRADNDADRLEAYRAVSNVFEDELKNLPSAFHWLRRACFELASPAKSTASEAFALLVELTERRDLWSHLCDFHIARAKATPDENSSQRLTDLQDASRILEDRLDDPFTAARTLIVALDDDPQGDEVLGDLRRLSQAIDQRDSHSGVPIGALVLLTALQRLLAKNRDTDVCIAMLEERASIREHRMSDPPGAMAEWLRVLRLDPDREHARSELFRLAQEHNLWSNYLLMYGAQLEQAANREAQARLLLDIAEVYETNLNRPEYALRARLGAWFRTPLLPDREGELDPENAAIWRLAAVAGAYQTPPVPRDPLLMPALASPEPSDEALWQQAQQDPAVLTELPSPLEPTVETADVPPPAQPVAGFTERILVDPGQVAPQPRQHTEPMDVEAPASVSSEASGGTSDNENVEDIEELDIEELEELDLDEIEEIDEDEAHAAPTRPAAPPPPPPPPPSAGVGLPAPPRLARTILPARPRVGSAWEEVALVYSKIPKHQKYEQADTALVLARLWDEGAGNLERAFQAHEQALLLVPEYEPALSSLSALADRLDATDRLLAAHIRLLREATTPDLRVSINMRIAGLYEAGEDLERAKDHYKGALKVEPHHLEALRALCRIYTAQERWADYVNAAAELLEAESTDLDADTLVSRTLELCEMLTQRVQRRREAIERLELLSRQFPERREVHAARIELLIAARQWQHAIEALRNASENIDDDELRIQNLVRIAEIYEQRLGLPDRALAQWSEIAASSDDERALSKLQSLYLDTGRFDAALPIIERRLASIEDPQGEGRDLRISLLVAKARALQEGVGDEAAATATLEELTAEAPENDEVAMGLSRLYRQAGRLEDGIKLIRERWQTIPHEDTERYVALTRGLVDMLDREGHDPKGALEIIERALEAHPDDETLLGLRVRLARTLHDELLLAETLSRLPNLDGLLEAAGLWRTLGDTALALRLYSRVLAEAKSETEDPEGTRRLAGALEGLVRLRVDDGDIKGAMEFMDRQLAETTGKTIRAQLLTEMGRIIYRSTGDVDAARERFDDALSEDDDYAKAKLGLGEVLIDAGQFDEAQHLLEQAVDALGLMPRHVDDLVEALVLLSRVLDDAGRTGDAYRRLNTAARHDPENLEIRAAIVRNRFNARRFRDTVNAADLVEEQLAKGVERTPKQMHLVSEIFVQAAWAEIELKQTDKALVRLRRAAQFDPGNAAALEPLIGLCQERGDLVEAAQHAQTLARQTDDDALRGQRYIEAGMLYHDAAAAMADGGDVDGVHGEEDLRKAAFENLRLGLELLEKSPGPLLDVHRLEVAFHACAQGDPPTALRCLDRLLLHDQIPTDHRHDLLLDGVRIALAGPVDTEAAGRYANEARRLMPGSSAAVLAQARVLEANDQVDEIEAMVETYLRQDEQPPQTDEDKATRVRLLLRLAELQRSRPEKAISALERAAELDPNGLTPDDRRMLAGLYDEAQTVGHKPLRNHAELLTLDPLYAPSLSALGHHYKRAGNLERAYALYHVLTLADPTDETARAFVSTHERVSGTAGEFDADEVAGRVPQDAGVCGALVQLWEHGAAALAEHLPRVEVSPQARISPVGDTLLARSWGDTLKRLGQSKIALADGSACELRAADSPDGAGDGAFFEVRCQHPPIIIAKPAAMHSENEAELRFAMGRALYFARAETIFAMGLRRTTLARVLSATLLTFHPRHSRRKHHQKSDAVAKLSHELARKLPTKAARQLTRMFKERESESFDSEQWRAWIRRSGNRLGLTLGGDVEAAVRVVLGGREDTPTGTTLHAAVEDNPDLRELISYATSDRFVAGRKHLGFSVRAKP